MEYLANLLGAWPLARRRTRRRQIQDDQERAAAAELETAWHMLAERRRRDPARFADEWRRHADLFDWRPVNELIDRHNRHFPAEVNLPMDVRTRDYVAFNGTDYRLRALDSAWILERFPPDLAVALD